MISSDARLSFVFPLWNEEAMVRRTARAAVEVGDDLVRSGCLGSYELVLVDDASTDATGELIDVMAEADPRISVVHHARNRKLGGALRSGFAAATGDVVLYTDADLPCEIAEVGKALRLMRLYEADIVSAYRFDRTAEGARRAAYSYVYNHLVRWALGVRIRDVNFAFKLIHRRVLDDVELVSEGSFVDAELVAKAHRRGYRIVQFGVDYVARTRGVSTLSSPAVIATIAREMRALRPQIRRIERLPDHVLDGQALAGEGSDRPVPGGRDVGGPCTGGPVHGGHVLDGQPA
jgi:glycosyltransferase involved in cell wall biosynthesis